MSQQIVVHLKQWKEQNKYQSINSCDMNMFTAKSSTSVSPFNSGEGDPSSGINKFNNKKRELLTQSSFIPPNSMINNDGKSGKNDTILEMDSFDVLDAKDLAAYQALQAKAFSRHESFDSEGNRKESIKTEQESAADNWLPQPFGPFADTAIRKAFIRKVYGILAVQLSFTILLGVVFLSVPDVKNYFKYHPLYAVGSLLFAMVPLFILTCCSSTRRSFPWNFILLTIFSVLQGFAIATLTCAFNNEVVIMAFVMCAAAVLAVSLLSTLPCLDVTKCGSLLLALLVAQMFMGLGIFTMFKFTSMSMRPLHMLYSISGAIIFMLFLAYDTQVILGGRKYQLSPEEYIYGAITLYMDILNIFMYFLQIVNMGSGSAGGGGGAVGHGVPRL